MQLYELTVASIHESKSITASNDYEFTLEANGNYRTIWEIGGKSRILFYIEMKDGKVYIKGLGEIR